MITILGLVVADTPMTLALADNSEREGYEHLLDPDLRAGIDPKRKARHILQYKALVQGRGDWEDFVRCALLVKVKRQVFPVTQQHFDVRLRDYLALPGSPSARAQLLEVSVGRAFTEPDERTPQW